MPRGINLHARDIEVLERLANRQIDNLDYFHKQLWAGRARKSAYNRLRALATAGYLEHIKRADPAAPKTWKAHRPTSEHLFTLGPKAPTALRIRGRESAALARRHRRGGISAALIDHQLATNRVADALGVRLMDEHEVSAGIPKAHHKHRPDGAYRGLPDERGNDLILVEVDLGHYSRERIIRKAYMVFHHEQARSMIYVCPTEERAAHVRGWVWNQVGVDHIHRFHILTFDDLKDPEALGRDYAPVHQPPEDDDPWGWWRDVMGPPGCR